MTENSTSPSERGRRPRRSQFLPFNPPQVGEEEIEAVGAALRSGWITAGPKTHEFAERIRVFVDAPAALAVNSCTAALHIALAAWGVGPGDAVYTTPMTFTSTVHVIEHVGATPVLVDIDDETMNIDPDLLAAAIARCIATGHAKPRVILPVHFAGQPAEMNRILDVARRFGLAVLEDAAHALPAAYHGKPVGHIGDGDDIDRAVAFSFYATKNLTTGEGGALVGSAAFIDEARLWSLHGMERDAWKRYGAGASWHYEVTRPGFKYNMTDLQAAIGGVQLDRLAKFDESRREIVSAYTRAFRSREGLRVPMEVPNTKHAWHLFPLRLDLRELTIDRNTFIEELTARNIGTSVHFIPIHRHAFYRKKYAFTDDSLPMATKMFGEEISLPIYPSMTERDVEDVVSAVCEIHDRYIVAP